MDRSPGTGTPGPDTLSHPEIVSLPFVMQSRRASTQIAPLPSGACGVALSRRIRNSGSIALGSDQIAP